MTNTETVLSPDNPLVHALQKAQQQRALAEFERSQTLRATIGRAVRALAGEGDDAPKAGELDTAMQALGITIADLDNLVGKLRAFREADAESDLAAAEKELGEILRKNSAEWAEFEANLAELQQAMAEARNRHYSESVVARERMNHARYAAPARRDALRADLELAGVQL